MYSHILQHSAAQALPGPEMVSLCLIGLVRFYPPWVCLITFWSQACLGGWRYLAAMSSTSNCMLCDRLLLFSLLWTCHLQISFLVLALCDALSNGSFLIFSILLMVSWRLMRRILSPATQSWHTILNWCCTAEEGIYSVINVVLDIISVLWQDHW